MEQKGMLLFCFYFFIFGCLLTTGNAKSRSISSVIQGVKDALKRVKGDTRGVLASLKDLKSNLNDNNDQEEETGELLENVGAALTKLGSGEAVDVISGCLDVVSGIASAFGGPIGLGIGAVASFISSIIGLFSGAGQKSVGEVIDTALKEFGDVNLQRQASGAKRDFAESTAFIKVIKMQKNLTDSDLSVIASNVPFYKFSTLLGALENRIEKGAYTTSMTEAQRVVDLILLYSQLVVMREAMLIDLSILYRKSGNANHIADAVDNANQVNKEFAKNTLKFLHNMLPEQVLLGASYYPIENSKRSQSILSYIRYFGVKTTMESIKPGNYKIVNEYWKEYSICSDPYMDTYIFHGCFEIDYNNIRLQKLKSGHYTMKNTRKRKAYVTKHAEGWVWGTLDNDPGPQGHMIFIPLKSKNYMISSQKWPNWFLYMESSTQGYIRSWQGNPGRQGHWKIIKM